MTKKLYTILFILFILLPLGLVTEYSAWGEWDPETYQKLIGYIPKGIQNSTSFSLIPDYGEGSVIMYYISGMVGMIVIYSILFLMVKIKKNETD